MTRSLTRNEMIAQLKKMWRDGLPMGPSDEDVEAVMREFIPLPLIHVDEVRDIYLRRARAAISALISRGWKAP